MLDKILVFQPKIVNSGIKIKDRIGAVNIKSTLSKLTKSLEWTPPKPQSRSFESKRNNSWVTVDVKKTAINLEIKGIVLQEIKVTRITTLSNKVHMDTKLSISNEIFVDDEINRPDDISFLKQYRKTKREKRETA